MKLDKYFWKAFFKIWVHLISFIGILFGSVWITVISPKIAYLIIPVIVIGGIIALTIAIANDSAEYKRRKDL